MQNEELLHKLEDIEKKISFSKKQEQTDLSEIQAKVKRLVAFEDNAYDRILVLDSSVSSLYELDEQKRLQIMGLQNRIEDLENDGISDEQIAQIENNKQAIQNQSTSITDLENAVSVHSSKINTLLTNDENQQEDITNLSQNYSQLNNNFNTISDDVSTLSQNYNVHERKIQIAEQDIDDLEERIAILEQSNNENLNCDLPETFNFFNKVKFEQNQETYGIYENFFNCFFLTETTSLCKIKFCANVSKISDIDYTKTLNVYLNGEVIESRQYSGTGTTDDVIEFEYYFYPQTKHNSINLKSTEKNNVKKKSRLKLIDCKIEIFGRNVTILNRDTTFKVFPCENKYYITKNVYENALGKIMDIGDTEWNENFFDVPRIVYNVDDENASAQDKSIYSTISHTILPIFSYDSDNSRYTIDSTNYLITSVFCHIQCIYQLANNLAPQNYYDIDSIGFGSLYAISTPGENDEVLHVCSVRPASNYMLSMNKATNKNLNTVAVTLNGESLDKIWVWCTPVIFNDWVTNCNHTYMCIGLDEFGNNIFFPTQQATYSIDLGVGAQTTAFGQPDGSINVYMSIANKIFKKVLTFNSTSQKYELTSSEFFCIGNEYIEGILDDYFIKKGETWIYVPPTSSTQN